MWCTRKFRPADTLNLYYYGRLFSASNCANRHCCSMGKRAASSTGPPGGYRQRARWSAEGDRSEGHSALSEFLLTKWAWGELSAPLVQQIAACAQKDGANHAEVKILAGLGSQGHHPRNCHPELVSKLKDSIATRALTTVSVFGKKSPWVWLGLNTTCCFPMSCSPACTMSTGPLSSIGSVEVTPKTSLHFGPKWKTILPIVATRWLEGMAIKKNVYP